MNQKIGFARSTDNIRIAYASSGNGPPLVRVGTWLTHLHHDWDSAIWKHWFEFQSSQHTLIRYDPRACGLSDGEAAQVNFNGVVSDLEAVVDHLELERFPLFGMSQGVATAVEYAARHPERVSCLILYSGVPVGWDVAEPDSADYLKWNATETLIRSEWGSDNPAIRSMFINYFVPDATPEEQLAYAVAARKSASKEVAGAIMRMLGSLNVLDRLPELQVPTQVIQISEDALTPPIATQVLMERIPNAELVVLDSKNHILRGTEPAWPKFKSAVDEFLSRHSTTPQGITSATVSDGGQSLLADLTDREEEILRHLALGHKNSQIAETLFISEKTVRNHITNVFSKLGVNSRAEAIVLAKDNGL
jgi:pimeloyl-ACP methyl ester carboxylesterase/DNA-binding CsgD family transcriptional regulator